MEHESNFFSFFSFFFFSLVYKYVGVLLFEGGEGGKKNITSHKEKWMERRAERWRVLMERLISRINNIHFFPLHSSGV